MEFKIPVGELQTIISKLSNVVKMGAEDVTSMIYIKASNEELTFKATSGLVHVIISANNFEVIEEGKVLCKLRDIKGYLLKFSPFAENSGTEDFHFVVKNDEGLIKAKTLFTDSKPSYRRLKFEIFNIAEHQPIKPFGEAQMIVNSNILKQGIEKVLHCIDPKDVRDALKGLKVVVDNNSIVFVGTNGIKLAEDIVDINVDIKNLSKIFNYDLCTVLHIILEDDSQVFINFEGRQVYLKSDNMYIVGHLVIGEDYPDYKALFKCEEFVTFPRRDFTDSVITVMDVLDPEDNHRLTINFSGNELILKNDVVEALHKFDDVFGTELDIDVNGVALASILRDFTGEYLEAHFTKNNNYIIFKSKDDDKHTALLTIVRRR